MPPESRTALANGKLPDLDHCAMPKMLTSSADICDQKPFTDFVKTLISAFARNTVVAPGEPDRVVHAEVRLTP